jgi:Pectate lyase superfamily protein
MDSAVVRCVPTVGALRELAPAPGGCVLVSGYHQRGDGGGGTFSWDTAAGEPHNAGTVISPASNPPKGRWKRWADGPLSVRWFGARGDGVTDDSAAFTAALGAYGVRGRTVFVPDGRYLLDRDLTIPDNCGIRGSLTAWKQAQPSQSLASGAHGVLIVNAAATITLNENSSIEQLTLVRKGLRIGEPDSSLFSGTAIKSINAPAAGKNSGVIRSVQILGFTTAIDLRYHHRAHLEKISGDNVNGIRLETSWDVLSIEDVHFWPYVTNPYVNERLASTGVLDLTPNHRSGNGIWLLGKNDIPQISNIFTFGYSRGIFVNAGFDPANGIGDATFINCHTDNTQKQDGSVGIFILGNTNFTTLTACSSYSNTEGFHVTAGPAETVHFVGCRAIGNSGFGFNVESGIARLIGCTIDMGDPTRSTQFGVNVGPAGAQASVTDCTFSGVPPSTVVHLNAYLGGAIVEQHNRFNSPANIGG